ncbi:SDR family oxidoreductase [Roseovarius spongiae]|uniref:SDR family oxidoreductase n=2 Tax=Roseovarius spongiae TaxID=2320272 RepID=A0A3A8BCB9_9RHOB|nr:SDR family oxidoreductase [Roseovarius spongiae]
MKGLCVAIVGGGSGFGREIALMMVEQGVEALAIIDANAAAAAETCDLIANHGGAGHAIHADIATMGPAHAGFDQAVQAMGRVDSLVNCAAVYPRAPLMEITDEQWDLENAINIKGTYHMCVAAIRHMQTRANGRDVAGRIVNITSVDAFKAHPQNAHYAATKAAVVSLTRSFAIHVASDQILVNSVAPAGMATEKAKSLGFLGELAAANPLGRAAEPREIAEFVLIAASNRNTYMTGEQIIVSGGYVCA